MNAPTLFLSRDPHYDYLSAIEFGRVADGQPPSCWRPVDDDFAYFVPVGLRRPRGFHVVDFSGFDPEDPELGEIWSGPTFDVPVLGLADVTAGEIVLAARAWLGDGPTVNRAYFELASNAGGERALTAWRCCLETGDLMAHFAIGYTLFELERYHEAYRHLRLYTELSPHSSWNWCWLGKAAAAIGETNEALRAYARAIELTDEGGDETDAVELIAELQVSGRR